MKTIILFSTARNRKQKTIILQEQSLEYDARETTNSGTNYYTKSVFKLL